MTGKASIAQTECILAPALFALLWRSALLYRMHRLPACIEAELSCFLRIVLLCDGGRDSPTLRLEGSGLIPPAVALNHQSNPLLL